MAKLGLKSGGGLENLSTAGKLAVGITFILTVGVGYFLLFYADVDGDISTQRQLLTTKKAELAKAEEADQAYNKDLTELERKKQLVQQQKKILPDNSETPALLSTLQTVATISGVRLTSWTPQEESAEDFYAKVPMELKLQGRYHQVAKFFHGIGQVDRIINIENITIKVVKDTNAATAADEVAGDRNVEVEVQCLATAFRALGDSEGGGRRSPGRRGGK